MRIDFPIRSLLVIDLWIAMSVVTSVILELLVLSGTNGYISVCILAGGVLFNLIVCMFMVFKRRTEREKKI